MIYLRTALRQCCASRVRALCRALAPLAKTQKVEMGLAEMRGAR